MSTAKQATSERLNLPRLTRLELEWLEWAQGGQDDPTDIAGLIENLTHLAPDLVQAEYGDRPTWKSRLRPIRSLVAKLESLLDE